MPVRKSTKKKASKEKQIIGLTEYIVIHTNEGKKKRMKARVDTGADSNSIDIDLLKSLKASKLKRKAIVKSANGRTIREVVNMDVEIAGKKFRGRFTVADRSKLKYKVLIGKDILKRSGFLINPKKA